MKNSLVKEIINLIYISIGGILLVVGVNLFLKPAGVYATGLLGLAQELSQIIFHNDTQVVTVFWAINLPLIIFGFFFVGKKFLIRTIFAVIAITVSEKLIVAQGQPLIDDNLLAVICGSILVGLGTGIALNRGGSTGGTDIIATYLSIIKGKSFGAINILVNSIVVLLAVILTKSVEVGVYMLISIYVAGLVIDQIHNYNQKMTMFIVTNHYEEIVSHVTTHFQRGITVFDSMGGYTKKPNKTLMITVSKQEINNVTACVKQVDPHCFINIFNAQKVLGTFKDNYVEML